MKLFTPKNICVIGLWHLGCVVASCLAEAGHNIIGVDFEKKLIENLKKGRAPLFEPGLDVLIKKNIRNKRLTFTTSFKDALRQKDFLFITFDVPVDEKDKFDLSIIYKACLKIARYAPDKFTLVVMSQIPVGTSETIRKFITKHNPNLSFEVIYNPENLMLGNAIKKFVEPDRVIIGVENYRNAQKIKALYSFIKSPHLVMDLKSAEMVKHATNAYLASSISFINEIADLCEEVDANVVKVVEGLKTDRRIGPHAYLSPGLGFSGGTLSRDLRVLQMLGRKKQISTRMIEAILKVNAARKEKIINKVKNLLGPISGKIITVFGFVYKPGTSTLRRSIALEISKKLALQGALVRVFDPKITNLNKKVKGLEIYKNPYRAAKNSELILLLTEWPEFRKLNFLKIKELMRTPRLLDSKNFLDPERLRSFGFIYVGVGIGATKN